MVDQSSDGKVQKKIRISLRNAVRTKDGNSAQIKLKLECNRVQFSVHYNT